MPGPIHPRRAAPAAAPLFLAPVPVAPLVASAALAVLTALGALAALAVLAVTLIAPTAAVAVGGRPGAGVVTNGSGAGVVAGGLDADVLTGPAAAGTDAYYAAALGRSGDSLKAALHTIIATGVTKLSYSAVWDALKVTDEDPDNPADVRLLYSGLSRAKTRNGGGSGDWNREHVWAKSHGGFGTAAGPGTDLHHLRPEDVAVNSARDNKDFDTGGSAVRGAPGNLTDGDSWEPRNAVKGDVARMIFYMAVRYEGDDAWPDLEVDNATSGGTGPRLGRLSALLTWNAQDPPDASERHRNEVVYARFQHNRNPFVDHPEWVTSIFG
jgi:endonuclease I